MKHVSFRLMIILGLTAAVVTGCSRDPNVRKQKYFESGQRYFAKGKYREAAIQYRNATEVDPTFAAAHYQMAEAFIKLQDWQDAYAELGRTLDLQPDNYKAHQEIANLLIASGQPGSLKMAQEHADLLQQKLPNDPETHIVLSGLLGREKNYNQAVAEAKNAIALSPNNGDYYLRLAVLQTETNLPDAAEENFKKAIDLKATALNPHLALAAFYQSRSRYPEAEQQVQQVIASDLKDTDSRAALVKLYMAEGKRAEAESFLKEVKQQFPDTSAGYRMLGDFYFAVNDFDKATAEYESLYHDHPKDLLVQRNYIQLLLLKNRVDDAKKIDDALLKAHAKDPEGLTFRGEIQMRQSKPGDAVQTLQSVLSSNPDMAMAHYQLGLAEGQTGDMDRAATEWRQAAQLNPSMIEAHRALAAYAMQKKDMSGLEQEATQIIGLQPASADGYALRAFSLTQRKQFAGSEQDSRKAIELAPQAATGYLQMGNLRAAQGKFAESESWFKQALTHDPQSNDALHNLMEVYVGEKHPEKAIAVAQEQIKLAPDNSALYTLLGSTQMTTKDYAGAQTSLQKAVELNKSNAQAYLLLIRAQLLMDKVDAALATCAAAERDNPKESAFYAFEGSGHEKKHDLQAAKNAYQKALDLRRDDPVISNNLAYVLLETNSNPDLALQLAQTARRGMPENANAADTLGWAFYQKGVYQSAISMFSEAIKLAAKHKEPESATYHYHLGLAYAKVDQPAQAKENFERVLKIDPNYTDAADVKKQLAQLKS
jgi:tetratricopeptide (TPR) repeat protein